MKTTSILTGLFATVFFISPAHSQLSFNNAPKVVPPCPVVKPQFDSNMDVPEYFNTYLRPVREYTNYIGNLVKGKAPGPMHINAMYQILREQYTTLNHLTKNTADINDFVNDISRSYYNNVGFVGLNTHTAAMIARAANQASLVDLFNLGTLCVIPSSSNAEAFEMNFYGVRQKDCQGMTRFEGLYASTMLVNGKPSLECVADLKASAIRPYMLWSNLGQNQVTLVFLKRK